MLDHPADLAVVRSIHEISHVLGKKTIAEGVESERMLRKLREVGIDFAQGFHLGRPRPRDGVDEGSSLPLGVEARTA